MEQKLSRYQNLIVLLITLLLHGGILLTIILMKFDHPQQEAMVMLADDAPEPHQAPQNNWVSMQQAMQQPSPAQPIAAKQPMQQPSAPEQQIAKQESPKESTDEPSVSAKATPDTASPAPTINEDRIQSAVALAQKLLERAEKREAPKEEPKEKPLEESPPPTEQLVKQTSSSANAPADKKKPDLTLAQLTQGFMQHLQESPMTVQSQNQGQASMEQLQQMHYMQKIIGCIVNSYKIHNNSNLRGYNMNPARIELALNKDGTIHTLQLVQSSGNMTIDQFLMNMFQDASSSFPPLPSSFKEQTLHLPTFNVDRLESFQNVQGWYIDNTMR